MQHTCNCAIVAPQPTQSLLRDANLTGLALVHSLGLAMTLGSLAVPKNNLVCGMPTLHMPRRDLSSPRICLIEKNPNLLEVLA